MRKKWKIPPVKFCSKASIVHGFNSYFSMIEKIRKAAERHCMYTFLRFLEVLLDYSLWYGFRILKPGLHTVVTTAEHVWDDAPKGIFTKLSTHQLRIFLVKDDVREQTIYVQLKVTSTTFWLKCKNLPKCTKFCSTRKLDVAAKNVGLSTKKSSHALANTAA